MMMLRVALRIRSAEWRGRRRMEDVARPALLGEMNVNESRRPTVRPPTDDTRPCQGTLALNAKGHLEREYRLKDFRLAMALANKVADIAEAQSHHPDLSVAWGQVQGGDLDTQDTRLDRE